MVAKWRNPTAVHNPSVSFSVNVLSADTAGGYLALLKQAGCKSMAAIEDPAGETGAALAIYLDALMAAAKRFGIDDKGEVTVPASAPDLTPCATEAANKGTRCLETLAVGRRAVSALKALVPLTGDKFDKAIICTACLSIPGTAAAETPLVDAPG